MDSIAVGTLVMLPFTHEVNSAGAHSTASWAYDDADGAVTVELVAPPGTTSAVDGTYTYGTSASLTREATGKYTLSFVPDVAGVWTWYVYCAGTTDPGRDKRELHVTDRAP